MELFFMRHGVAESPEHHGDAGQRPLTEQGRHDQRRMALKER